MKSEFEYLVNYLKENFPNGISPDSDLSEFNKFYSTISDGSLENFFKWSSVDSFFKRHSRNIDSKDNLFTDYDGRKYIRLMKYFNPSLYIDGSPLIADLITEDVRAELVKPFYLRIYLPKEIISTIGKKIDKVIILFNGMNELQHFHLYDKIGEFFASNNVAVILLPTPFHLNRRIKSKYPTEIALENNNELLFLYSYLESYRELQYLVSLLRKEKSDDDLTHNFSFYDNYFHDKVKISLMGYSLGGLRALGFFMRNFKTFEEFFEKYQKEAIDKDDPNSLEEYLLSKDRAYYSCITLNSGPNLLDAQITEELAKTIAPEDWDILMMRLESSYEKYVNKIKLLNPRMEKLIDIFELLYFRADSDEKKNLAQINMHRIVDNYLAVSGGADLIIKKEQIQKFSKETLHQIIVAKGDHFLGKDKSDWYEVFPQIQTSIYNFIMGAYERHYNGQILREKIELLLKKTNKFDELLEECRHKFTNQSFRKILELLNDPNDESLFIQYYYRSKAFYPRFQEIIKNLKKKLTI